MDEFQKLLYEEIRGMRSDLKDHYDEDRDREISQNERMSKIEKKLVILSIAMGYLGHSGGKLFENIIKFL